MDYSQKAQELVHYFEWVISEYNQSDNWKLGLSTAQKWARLIESHDVAEEDILELARFVYENRHRGSGWFDMALAIWHWADARGIPNLTLKDFYSPTSSLRG